MGSWSSGIFQCRDSCTCCFACVCPCVVFCWNVKKMDPERFSGAFGVGHRPLLSGTLYAIGVSAFVIGLECLTVSPGLCALSLFGLIPVYLHADIRQTIKKKMQIESDCSSSDFCCAFWCYSCAMAQENRQLDVVDTQLTEFKSSMMIDVPIQWQ
jgi:Cys-rich protein (TIGR01571 family)